MSVHMDDLELLNAVRDFALMQTQPVVDKFKPAIGDWGNDWIDVGQAYLPAANLLNDAIINGNSQTQGLLEIFARHKDRLYWEQSYKKEDDVVSDSMLAAYGFAEIIGKQGPFVSERIRAGIGIYGPNIVYPRHQHQAEEIYIILAGSAEFKIGAAEEARRSTGDVVYVESNTSHGFRTNDQSLVIYYLWQAGDLRQISSFG